MSLQAQLTTLRDEGTKAFAHVNTLRAKYDGDKLKNMTPDEIAEQDRAISDAEAIYAKAALIEREIRLEEANKAIINPIERDRETETNRGGDNTIDKKVQMEMTVFNKYLVHGSGVVDRFLNDEERAFLRDLSVNDPTKGGYITAPQQFIASLLKDIDNEVVMRGISTIYPCTDSTSLGIPTLDTDLGDADWTGEITQTTPDDVTFGKRELKPYFLSKEVKISEPLIRKSVLPADGIVRQRMAYKFGVTLEKAYITGTGNGQPLGVNTASANGVSTGRDITGATSLVIGANDLFAMYFNLKTGYAIEGTWLMSRDAISDIRQLKDGAGHYLWQPFDFPGKQLVGANPGSIIGQPYLVSEYAKFKTSGAWVAGNYAVTFGNFKYYLMADSLQLTMKTLFELYARTNQLGFLGRGEFDGMPGLENAFTRLAIKA